MKRPNILSPSHPAFAIAAGAVAGTAVIASGMFIASSTADRNTAMSPESSASVQSVSADVAAHPVVDANKVANSFDDNNTTVSTRPMAGSEAVASEGTPMSKSADTTAPSTKSAPAKRVTKRTAPVTAPSTKSAPAKRATKRTAPVTAPSTKSAPAKRATKRTTPVTAPSTKSAPAKRALVADVTNRNVSVFTTPQGLHCGMYGAEEGTSAFCVMDDRSVYPIPKDESSVCAGGDNPGELYTVTVDHKSGWGCIPEPEPEPVLTEAAGTEGVFYKPAIDWYKSSPFPAAVQGIKAASGKAYVPVGGVIKNGAIQCKVLTNAVKCENTSTRASFVFTNSSAKFTKERTYPGDTK